jgi:hypothetical protein
MCTPEQRQPPRTGTVTIMQLEHMRAAVAVAWVLTWGVIAVSLNVSSASSWILLVGSGVLPPLMLLRMWHPPARTMAESNRPGSRQCRLTVPVGIAREI